MVYLNPADLTALQLATAADDRPLISGDPTQGAPPVVAGLAVWATPAVPAAQALVAQADQIVVAVREDASVAVSDRPPFTQRRHPGPRDRARGRGRQRHRRRWP